MATNSAQQPEEDKPFEGFKSEAFTDGVADAVPKADPPAKESSEESESEEASADEDTSPDETAEESSEEEVAEPPKKAKRTAAERIAEITRLRREAERRADAAEQELTQLRSARTEAPKQETLTEEKDAPSVSPDGRPNPEKYKYGELDAQYIADLSTFAVDQRLAAKAKEDEQTRQQQVAAKEQEEFKTKLEQRFEKGMEKYDDFEEVVIEGARRNDWPLSQIGAQMIAQSEVGSELAYHLASNPKEALQVFSKAPLEQAAYFGRLEARFSSEPKQDAKSEPQAPKAPTPVKQPRGAGGKFTTSPSTENFADFEAMANAKG